MKKFIIITTINPKTEAIRKYESMSGWHTVIVADKKSVPIDASETLTFLSVQCQKELGYSIFDVCPYNHYTRKNIGYLFALQKGADIIFDTDDDNIPYDDWSLPPFYSDCLLGDEGKYVNIYRYFSDEFIWPRGYPLAEIKRSRETVLKTEDVSKTEIGVWQAMTDNEPDVDAVYRLLFNKKSHFFKKKSVFLGKGSYCPFNSQNTFWNKKAFPLLYLPGTVSFRFTDILRGYIAQRLMWRQELYTGFCNAGVYQERNVHDLMKDFADEVSCYLQIEDIVLLLDQMKLDGTPLELLAVVYRELERAGVVKKDELNILNAWMADYKMCAAHGRGLE